MKQIARVVLENFQSHARSELTFGPGLNVIVGPSDNGKSAVLRAIRWALYNEPRGSDFVRSGARECRVTVTMSDGAEVVRELLLTKSGNPSRNRYIVTLPGEEPQVFEGFGHDLPAEVTRAHGMPKVLLDSDKQVMLSFGSQLEGPFLLADTGSVRAKAIGRLLGVHVVDAAHRETQKDLRAVRQEMARLESQLARYDEELAQFADIPEQEERLAQAEAKAARASELDRRLQRLQGLQGELADRDAAIARVEGGLAALAGVEQAEGRLREAALLQERLAGLERLQRELDQVGGRVSETVDAIQRTNAELQRHLSEYGELLRRLGRCPTCLQPVAPESVDRIVAELAVGTGGEHSHGGRP